jgi:hypothetical protein
MNGDTYDGVLYSRGHIRKETFSAATGAWKEQKTLNNYFVMKGDKTFHCLDFNDMI